MELDLRRSRRANRSWRLRSFASADRRPRQARGRTAASENHELALPTHPGHTPPAIRRPEAAFKIGQAFKTSVAAHGQSSRLRIVGGAEDMAMSRPSATFWSSVPMCTLAGCLTRRTATFVTPVRSTGSRTSSSGRCEAHRACSTSGLGRPPARQRSKHQACPRAADVSLHRRPKECGADYRASVAGS